jgi:hypothetical protein
MTAPGHLMSDHRRKDEAPPAPDQGRKPSAEQHHCPVCGKVLGLARWSDVGTEFGCSQCGNWFQSDVIRDKPARGPQAEAADVPRFNANSILLPLRSATLRDAVDELVPRALHGAGDIIRRSAKIAESLKQGLNLQSVEYHHGLAFLHHRLKESPGPRMAMGISPNGLQPEGGSDARIFVVALFLRPLREPGYDIPLWARRTMCNDKMIYQLRTAPDITWVLKVFAAPAGSGA